MRTEFFHLIRYLLMFTGLDTLVCTVELIPVHGRNFGYAASLTPLMTEWDSNPDSSMPAV